MKQAKLQRPSNVLASVHVTRAHLAASVRTRLPKSSSTWGTRSSRRRRTTQMCTWGSSWRVGPNTRRALRLHGEAPPAYEVQSRWDYRGPGARAIFAHAAEPACAKEVCKLLSEQNARGSRRRACSCSVSIRIRRSFASSPSPLPHLKQRN